MDTQRPPCHTQLLDAWDAYGDAKVRTPERSGHGHLCRCTFAVAAAVDLSAVAMLVWEYSESGCTRQCILAPRRAPAIAPRRFAGVSTARHLLRTRRTPTHSPTMQERADGDSELLAAHDIDFFRNFNRDVRTYQERDQHLGVCAHVCSWRAR